MDDKPILQVLVRNLFTGQKWLFNNDILWADNSDGISSVQIGDYTGVIIYLKRNFELKKFEYGYDIVQIKKEV